jgi:hypothetical protein
MQIERGKRVVHKTTGKHGALGFTTVRTKDSISVMVYWDMPVECEECTMVDVEELDEEP